MVSYYTYAFSNKLKWEEKVTNILKAGENNGTKNENIWIFKLHQI